VSINLDAFASPYEDRYATAQAILDAVLMSHGGRPSDQIRAELQRRMLDVGIDWPAATLDRFASKISSGQGIALGVVDGNRG